MRIVLTFLCICLFVSYSKAGENTSALLLGRNCSGPDVKSERSVSEVACIQGVKYLLKYDKKLRKIILFYDRQSKSLQQFPRERDPVLVGADKVIGFLPDKLQIYKNRNIAVYVSSIRTNSGSGGGQCGSGSEIYLNFLSMERPGPRVSSKILIGSCDYSIELFKQTIPDGKIGEISTEGGKLLLHFLNYKNLEGSPVATVTADRKNLVFN